MIGLELAIINMRIMTKRSAIIASDLSA